MNRRWAQVMPVVLALISLQCIAMAFLHGKEGKERENIRTLQLKAAYDAQTAYELLSIEKKLESEAGISGTESVEFIIWGEKKGTYVSSRELNRSTSAVQVTVCGDSRIIFDSSHSLDETYTLGDNKLKAPLEDREKACLISPALALTLFGNADGSGQKIELGEDKYMVEGMLTCEAAVILIPALFYPDEELDKISFRAGEGMSAQQGLKYLTEHIGVQGDILSFHLYSQWAEFAAYLVPVLIYVILCLQMLRKIKRNHFCPALGIPMLVLAVFISSVIGNWIFDVHIEIPREILPSMWSDFGFWSDLWKRISQELSLLMKTGKSEMAMYDYRNYLKTAGYTIAAAVFSYLSFRRLIIKNSVFLWTAAAASMVITYLFFVLNMRCSVSLANNRILWMLMPVCFVMKYIGDKCSVKNIEWKR